MKKVLLSFAFLNIFFFAESLRSFDLVLQGQVHSGKEKLCFSDISSLRGETNDPQGVEKWKKLCSIPLPLQETFLSTSDIEVLLWKAGLFPQNIIGGGVKIKPKLIAISKDMVEKSITRFFPPPQYRFEILNPQETYFLPAELRGNFVLDHKKKSVGKRTLFMQNEKKENAKAIDFILYVRSEKYSSTSAIPKGSFIDARNTQPQYYYTKTNEVGEKILGKIAARDISIGESIAREDTLSPSRVSSGTVVFLTYANKNIFFSIYAKTKQSGLWGEIVKAQAVGGGREIKVRLTGADTAILIDNDIAELKNFQSNIQENQQSETL